MTWKVELKLPESEESRIRKEVTGKVNGSNFISSLYKGLPMKPEAANFQEIRVVNSKYPKPIKLACRYLCPCSQSVVVRQSVKYPSTVKDCPRCALTIACDIPSYILELVR